MSYERLSVLELDLLDLASDDVESTDLLIRMLNRVGSEGRPPEGEVDLQATVHRCLVRLVYWGLARSYRVEDFWNEREGRYIGRLVPTSFEELPAEDDGSREYWWEPTTEGRAAVEQQWNAD